MLKNKSKIVSKSCPKCGMSYFFNRITDIEPMFCQKCGSELFYDI